MREHKGNSTGGIGVTGLLGVAFIVLKLVGIINWSWLWVLSPFWISLGLTLLILVGYVLFTVWKVWREEDA